MTRKMATQSGAALLAATLSLGTGEPSDSGRHPRRIEGTWRVLVTTRDCASGEPLLSFRSMLTFASGGTLGGTTSAPLYKPGQRSPDYGVWTQTAHDQYRAVSEAYILFDSPPPPLPLVRGVQRITQAIQMDGRDRFDSDAEVEFFDVDGNVVLNLCATAVGTRLE